MSARGLRPLRWPDVPRAARMMAGAYLVKAAPEARSRSRVALTAAAVVAFVLSLAIYRPLVRYWRDPKDGRRQTVVAITPRGRTIVPVLRLVLGLALYAALVFGPDLDPANAGARVALGVLSLLAVAAGLVTGPAILVAAWVLGRRTYEGKIACAGPAVPGTQLTAGLAASTSAAGMLAVRADLAERHGGERLTVRARDVDALTLYGRLGLEVVEPGCGRMTGIIPGR